MQSGGDGKKQLEFMRGPFPVSSQTKAPNLKQGFKVEQYSESDFSNVECLVIAGPVFTVVPEYHAAAHDSIGKYQEENAEMKCV